MKKFIPILALSAIGCFFGGVWIGRGDPEQNSVRSDPPSQGADVSEPLQPTHEARQDVPFGWSQLESTNCALFVQRLRSVGCPERTITQIIRSRLIRANADKFKQIAASGNFVDLEHEGRERVNKREQVNRQIESTMYDTLGLERPIRSPCPLFTAEQEEKMAEAVKLFPRLVNATDSMQAAEAQSNHLSRVAFLSRYLTERQIVYYNLDREGQGPQVESLLLGMQPTEDEFLAVAKAVEGANTRRTNDNLSSEAIDAVRNALSPDRFAVFEELQKPEYRGIIFFAMQHRLTPQTIAALVDLRRTIYTQDPESYRERVMAALNQPQVGARYLQDRRIHPVAIR